MKWEIDEINFLSSFQCLAQLSTTEALIEELRGAAKRVNDALKVAQTRLDNRLQRRNVESCRDVPQYGYEIKKKKNINRPPKCTLDFFE